MEQLKWNQHNYNERDLFVRTVYTVNPTYSGHLSILILKVTVEREPLHSGENRGHSQ